MSERPPFRADHVGSFLRPKTVVDARAQRAEGEIGPEELREVEDEAIAEVVRQQEDVGLKGITDGEFRRFMFHVDFLEQLDGVTVTEGNFLARFHRLDGSEIEFSPPTMGVDAPIRHGRPIQGGGFRLPRLTSDQDTKSLDPGALDAPFPGRAAGDQRGGLSRSRAVLRRLDHGLSRRDRRPGPEGARYVQMDDTNLAYLCDPEVRELTAARGDDPDELTRLYSRLVNDAFAGRPDDMVAAIHLCRGNFQSAWVTKGGYEPVAEILFNDMDVDAFFLEYDDSAPVTSPPLRFVPEGKMVVLGLMSSKLPDVEDADEVKKRIDEAAEFVPLGQLALSHQCGFSSTVHGNKLTPDDQWRKLARTVEVAGDVWGY